MKVKIKKLNKDAVVPSFANPGDAGADLTAVTKTVSSEYTEYGTGLSFEIPKGHVGLIFPRSSISKKDLSLANAVGVIDSSYRGEVTFRFKKHHSPQNTYNNKWNDYSIGDRIGQLVIMPYPEVEFTEATEELTETKRGLGGYGSSDLKK